MCSSDLAPQRYARLHDAIREGLVSACHDLSEGGLAVALAEMVIGGRLGASIRFLPHRDPTVAWFAESNSRFLCEVAPEHLERFLEVVGHHATVIGVTTDDEMLTTPQFSVPMHALVAAFTGGDR